MGVVTCVAAERDFSAELAARGYQVLFRANESNRCPGCGRAQWFVGRITAECCFCGTALPLAEAQWGGTGLIPSRPPIVTRSGTAFESEDWSERRRHERLPGGGRILQLLIDGSPHAFAVHDIASGGIKGDAPLGLITAKSLSVEFEGGKIVPATLKWTAGGSAGLAFLTPIPLDQLQPDQAPE